MGHIIVFDQSFLGGGHRHVLDAEPDLACANALDPGFAGPIWSFVILDGNWELFAGADYTNPYPEIYGPGLHEFANDDATASSPISSLRPSREPATQHGETPEACMTFFERPGFRGQHRHVFDGIADLPALAVEFAGAVSSMVITPWPGEPVEDVSVTLYTDVAGRAQTIGAGAICDLSAAQPTADARPGEVILFERAGFHGRHRHVHLAEPDLGAADDPGFANNIGSFAILAGAWLFCARREFEAVTPPWNLDALGTVDPVWPSVQPPPLQLSGLCPDVALAGMCSAAIMSLHLPQPDIYFWQTPATRAGHEAWWIVCVAGPHREGGIRIASPALALDVSDRTPDGNFFRHLTDYIDSDGGTCASVYCALAWLPVDEGVAIEVTCLTQGAGVNGSCTPLRCVGPRGGPVTDSGPAPPMRLEGTA